jgi:hypothetical protein
VPAVRRISGRKITCLTKEEVVAQYAVLIYAAEPADGVDAGPEDLQVHERHAKELEDSGRMAAAFALEPGGDGDVDPA